MGAELPLREGAVQVARDRAADLRDLDILVVVSILQMGREILSQPALAGLGDHGFRPRALKQAERISVRERTASSRRTPLPGPEAMATVWSWSRTPRELAEDLRDRLMLDGRPAGLARRIGAEDGFGDEGGGGQAGSVNAPFELRPQFLGRAVGDGRFPFVVVFRRHGPSAGSCSLSFASTLPRRSPGAAPGVQGALKPARSMGVRRESRNLPPGRSRRRNAGRGPGRESPVAGCKGVRPSPCSMGPGRAEVSLCRDATATRLRSAGTGSMPVSASSVRLTNPLARRSEKERASLGIALGGARGMGNPPAR